MKNTSFLWGWQTYAPTLDATMTRERMARLMRAWRRSKTQGRRNFVFACVVREPGKRVYRVSASGYRSEDAATVVVATCREHQQ